MRRFHRPFIAISSALACVAAASQDCSFQQPAGATGKMQVLAKEASGSNPCAVVPGLTAKSLKTVWTVLTASGRTGGKRFDTEPPVGTPTGRVLMTGNGVTFDLREVAAQRVQNLELTTDGKPVFRAAAPLPQLVVVPAERLAAGQAYGWTLRTAANIYRGDFELLSAEESAQVQSRLDAIEAARLGPQLRLLYRAAVFDDAELYGARDEALAGLH